METPCPDHEAALAGGRAVIGVDEVGRGPLAGPVVAAAAYLPDPGLVEGLRDSKALGEARREVVAGCVLAHARVAVAGCSAALIDAIGIEKATRLAMQRAVLRLAPPQGVVILVDGNRAPEFGAHTVITEIKADASCPSVAAASIVAKVARDRAMVRLAARYAAYGWHTNKGYGSAAHRRAILEAGPTPHHRRSFLGRILEDAA